MNRGEIAIFAPGLSREFGEKVSAHLGVPLIAHEEREFEDGEHKIRPLINVRGKDVFVIQSLYGDDRNFLTALNSCKQCYSGTGVEDQ